MGRDQFSRLASQSGNEPRAFNRIWSARSTLLWVSALAPFFCAQPALGAETSAAKKSVPAASHKVVGRVFDAMGNPLAGAMVWLTRRDEGDFLLPDSTVIAEARSQADGRFELAAPDSELNKPADDPPAEFEVWLWKPGLALAHASFFDELPREQVSIFMHREMPVVIRLRNPDGSECGGATVRPVVTHFQNGRFATTPKPIQDHLQARSVSDGRVNLLGCNGDLAGLSIEKTGLGVQTIGFSEGKRIPSELKLSGVRRLEGRLVIPQPSKIDLSRLKITVRLTSTTLSEPAAKQEPVQSAANHPSSLGATNISFAPIVMDGSRFPSCRRASTVTSNSQWDRSTTCNSCN